MRITTVHNSGMDRLSQDQAILFELEQGQNGKTSAVNLKTS